MRGEGLGGKVFRSTTSPRTPVRPGARGSFARSDPQARQVSIYVIAAASAGRKARTALNVRYEQWRESPRSTSMRF